MCKGDKKCRCHKDHCGQKEKQWDYVIVGAGNAGCPLAKKLSDPDPVTGKFKNSVLVIEAGENLTNDPYVLVNNIYATNATAINSRYTRSFQANLTSQDTPLQAKTYGLYSEGCQWGGGSGHNGCQWFRGAPAQYDQWAALTGDNRWSYNNLLNNVLIPMEHYTPDGTLVNPTQRGLNGPVFSTQEPPMNTFPLIQAIAAGCNAPYVSDLNDPTLGVVGTGANQDSVTPTYLGPNSFRSYAANSYLTGISAPDAVPPVVIPPIVDENGKGLNGRKLKILSRAHVNRVLFDEQKNAYGVEFVFYTDKQKCCVAKARKEVILAAGSTQTPAILQRSGVGDSTLLTSLDIPVVYDNPNVGQNLKNHYGSITVVSGEVGVDFPPFFPTPETAVSFINLSPYMPNVNDRLYQVDILSTYLFLDAGIATCLGITSGANVFPFNIQPNATGSVQITNKDPFIDPQINLNLYGDGGDPSVVGSDAYKIVSFFKILKNQVMPIYSALSGKPQDVLYPSPAQYAGGDDALFKAAVESNNFFAYHVSCTARMGKTPATAVCDSKQRVFGVNNLRIADNSAAPVIETGNTQVQAYVLGLMCAYNILGHF